MLKVHKEVLDMKLNPPMVTRAIPKVVDELPYFFENGEVFDLDGTLYRGTVVSMIGMQNYTSYKFYSLKLNKESLLKLMEVVRENNPDVTDDDYDYSYILLFDEDATSTEISIYVDRIVTKRYNEDIEDSEEAETLYKDGKWYKDSLIFDKLMHVDELYYSAYTDEQSEKLDSLSYGKIYSFTKTAVGEDVNDDYARTDVTFSRLSEYAANTNLSTVDIFGLYAGLDFNKAAYFKKNNLTGATMSKKVKCINIPCLFSNTKGLTLEMVQDFFSRFNKGTVVENLYGSFGYSDITYFDFNEVSNITFKPTVLERAFCSCHNLQVLKGLDCKRVYTDEMLHYCTALTELELFNITESLNMSQSNLLTVDSLVHTIQELIEITFTRTLTMGSTNLAKLEDVYVRYTGEDEEDEDNCKYPCEVCNEDDDGAMSIIEYANNKNWTLA